MESVRELPRKEELKVAGHIPDAIHFPKPLTYAASEGDRARSDPALGGLQAPCPQPSVGPKLSRRGQCRPASEPI